MLWPECGLVWGMEWELLGELGGELLLGVEELVEGLLEVFGCGDELLEMGGVE